MMETRLMTDIYVKKYSLRAIRSKLKINFGFLFFELPTSQAAWSVSCLSGRFWDTGNSEI